ncbi:Hypothetical protein R9X50_00171700 [Acrodontium crateriforme]|uniref:Peroxin 8 n=1 Tax=Acrodontium crateriforme TaxID=150365 RepID=A0AAQ3RAA3_9PEZI|nr:Hypothetical protein R9X50_00171700 [Acrodontium crateriforme]
MPADRLLGTLLRSLRTYTDQQDTPRLLGTASSLLTTLNNPLNVTLLTSQLLTAPAIWTYPTSLQTSTQTLSVFHSAALALIRHEDALAEKSADHEFTQLQLERTLPKDEWIRAVISGADEHSPRWRHLLVLGGLLVGFGPFEQHRLSSVMRSTIEAALTTATNLVLERGLEDDELGQQSLTFVLNHCFPVMSNYERSRLNYDLLLPILMRATLFSSEGLQSGYFLGIIDADIRVANKTQFQWSERSPSYQQIQKILSSPLTASLGPLSRLIGHAIEQVKQSWLITAALGDLERFSKILHTQWSQIKLSEIDASEESAFLDSATLEKTSPNLWKLLRSTLFATVIMLRSAVGRMLGDRALANDKSAPLIAAQSLHILRYLYFISSRLGATTFSQYSFVYLTAMDILCVYPQQTEAFVQSIKSTEMGRIPQHPLQRCLDLFFLNTVEHFTLTLSPVTCENILISSAAPYLVAGGNNNLLPIFEAAHSVMLAVFSGTRNSDLTTKHLPLYVDSLFKVFPTNLSSRQFRLAFKTLLQITSPPSQLSVRQPLLAATLLELLFERSKHASTVPLPSELTSSDVEGLPESEPPLSEQAVLALTILDTLVHLSVNLLDEWLPLAAEVVNSVDDGIMREHCKEHFWHILVDGEMDPNRSQVCHAWWTTGGGREMVLFGNENGGSEEVFMSGGLPIEASTAKL